MQINNKVFHVAYIICSLLAIVSVFLVSIEIAMLFLGSSQIFSGLNYLKLSQGIDSKETNKGNKFTGIFAIIVGLLIIIAYTIKLMF